MSSDPSYTVFIRLPFPRGDFVDPPPVEWDALKDKALWKILSKASKNSDIDWNGLASRFEVTLPFLLQQAAWLYERQLVQVRAQMRKVGATKVTSAAPSPVPGSDSAGGEMMRRTTSGGGTTGPRVASALASRRDSPVPPKDGSITSMPARSTALPASRTSSTNTTITSRNFPPQTSPRPAYASLNRPQSRTSTANPETNSYLPTRSPRPVPLSPPSETTSPASSSSESIANNKYPTQSRVLRRPRFTTTGTNKTTAGRSEDGGDEDDDEEPAFLPFTTTTSSEASHAHSNDPSATLRGDLRTTLSSRRGIPSHTHKKGHSGDGNNTGIHSQTSDSSASTSSAAPTPVGHGKGKKPELELQRERERRGLSGPGPLSPRRTAELAGKRESSDPGTPSMGSSFSDLDDASVTQSALEEALASNMQAGGGMASRMSTISQALKSRYL